MSLLDQRYDAALQCVDAHLRKKYEGQRLNGQRDSTLLRFPDVWKIEIAERGLPAIYLALDKSFPATLPKVIVGNGDEFWGVIPHVNKDGSICTDVPHAVGDQADVERVTDHVINRAATILRDGLSGGNKNDFLSEIESYWSQAATSVIPIWSLIPPVSSSQEVSWIRLNGSILIGPDFETCTKWLENYGIENTRRLPRGRTACLKLKNALYPPNYFDTNEEALGFIGAEVVEVKNQLLQQLDTNDAVLPVLYQFDTENGPAQIAVCLRPKASRRRQIPGFRAGKAPATLLMKAHGSNPCSRHNVHRVYSEWIHTRGGAERGEKSLQHMHVALIGCGAIGGDVAQMLANAGVGMLTLIDGQLLDFDNIGRHLLGAAEVGQFKAKSLHHHLKRQFPHLRINSIGRIWEDLTAEEIKEMRKCDLIISATGEWTSESTLNIFARSVAKPAVLFGWTEPHGCAGHALLVTTRGGCLACGRDNLGQVSFRVTEWNEDTAMKRLPACGGFYQPYGAAETAPIKGMVATLAISYLLGDASYSELRTWIGDPDMIKQLGGNIMPKWKGILRKGLIGQTHAQRWEKSAACSQCQE